MQPCPRAAEATLGVQFKAAAESHWLPDGTCSYCGSLSPELFFKAILDGCELGPTDKNYKVYVDRPDPEAGLPWIYGSSSSPYADWPLITDEIFDSTAMPKGWRQFYVGHYGKVEPKRAIRQDKFYFQHLSPEDQQRFIELLNARQLRIGMPGHFYRLPFFVRKAEER